jgi:hypothetical protein
MSAKRVLRATTRAMAATSFEWPIDINQTITEFDDAAVFNS